MYFIIFMKIQTDIYCRLYLDFFNRRNTRSGNVEVRFNLRVEKPTGETEAGVYHRVSQVVTENTAYLPGNIALQPFEDMLLFEGRTFSTYNYVTQN